MSDFTELYRTKGPHTRLIRATGLGLAICKGLVDAHGDRIWVESPQGQGVTIGFMLPILKSLPTITLE